MLIGTMRLRTYRRLFCLLPAVLVASAALAAEGPEVTAADVDRLVGQCMPISAPGAHVDSASQTAATDLNQHVADMLAAGRLMPLVVVTGKTKVYAFHHPRELFQSMSVALPHLSADTRAEAVAYLRREYDIAPPFDPRCYKMTGAARCAGGNYDSVMPGSSTSGRAERSNGGMYAFWSFCYYGGQADLARRDWARVEQGLASAKSWSDKLLKDSPAARFAVELAKPTGQDESRRADGRAVVELNMLISNLIGIERLAEMTAHVEQAAEARQLLLPLVRERMRFPQGVGTYLRGWEPVLWYEMTPELMRLVAEKQGNDIRSRMDDTSIIDMKFNTRFARNNFWHLAWGEGCMTDEQTVAFPHVSRALYLLRVFAYDDPPDELLRLADMPWCMGDLYYIEKLTYTLWAAGGRVWTTPKSAR